MTRMTSRVLHHTRTLATTSTGATPPQRDGDDRLASSLDARFDELSKAHSPIEKRRRLTAEEEQDLILDGPGTRAMPQAPRLGEAYDTAAAAALVLAHGLCHFPGALDRAAAATLREHVDRVLDESKRRVAAGGVDSSRGAKGGVPYGRLFGPVMARADRYDVLLPLDELVLSTIRPILSSVEPAMRQLVGQDAYLCELSALISDPGAVAQPLHHDTSFDGCPPRVSLLVALQDVEANMGPTLFFPGTNTPEWHIRYLMRGHDLEGLLDGTRHCSGMLRAGDAVLYDTHLLHCASGAEDSPRRRTLLTLSAQEETMDNRGEQANIRRGYRETLQLRGLAGWEAKE